MERENVKVLALGIIMLCVIWLAGADCGRSVARLMQ